MNEALPLVLPLIGVILGGMLTVWGQYQHARRQERTEFHTALRLVLMDLHDVRTAASIAVAEGAWPFSDVVMNLPSLNEQAPVLARELSRDAWKHLDGVRSQLKFDLDGVTPLQVTGQDQLADIEQYVKKTIKLLEDALPKASRPKRSRETVSRKAFTRDG